MTSETKKLIREGFGAIEDELRQRRATDKEILKRLDVLIRLAGGSDAKITRRNLTNMFIHYKPIHGIF